MNKYCVVGGGGFIGKHLVNHLIKAGREVVVVGRRDRSLVELPTKVEYYTYTHSDVRFWAKALSKVDKLICVAYTTNPKTSYDNPLEDIIANIFPMVELCLATLSSLVKKIVIVSSGGAIYGNVDKTPINEDDPTNPISPYGITKLAIEKYALMFNQINKLPVTIVRPGNCYGPGQKPFLGQGFITTAIASILSNKEIHIFGENGTVRDYIYVTDVVGGILSALEYGKSGQCYNLGTGVGKNNLEIFKIISFLGKREGLKPKVKILSQRRFDVDSNILDSSKLTNISGWKPKIKIEKGIELTWQWLRKTYEKS